MTPRLLRSIVALGLPILGSPVIAPQPAHAAWSGWLRCTIENPGQGYINTETHTWFVDGVSTMRTGSWSVAGEGHVDVRNPGASERGEWSVSGHEPNVSFAVVVSAGRVTIRSTNGQSTQSHGISGYRQRTLDGKPPDAPIPIDQTAY